jgi:hypothetical protein
MIDLGGHAVLSDIGLEPLVNSFEPFNHITPRCRWLAPEMLIPDDEDTTVPPTPAADIYSTANTIEEVWQIPLIIAWLIPLILYASQVYRLLPPFNTVKSNLKFLWKHRLGTLERGEKPVNMAASIWQALNGCWAPQPEKRHTAQELLHCLEQVKVD